MRFKIFVFIGFLILFQASCKKDVCVTCYSMDTLNNNKVVESKKACEKTEGVAEKKAISKLSAKNGYHIVCEAEK